MYTKKVIDGYYEKTVQYDSNLKYCPYGSCGVMFQSGFGLSAVHLVSYTTLVCSIENGWLTCTGTYSRTTIKHIIAFLKEYAPKLNYHNAKYCYENQCMMNINTGEIVPIQ